MWDDGCLHTLFGDKQLAMRVDNVCHRSTKETFEAGGGEGPRETLTYRLKDVVTKSRFFLAVPLVSRWVSSSVFFRIEVAKRLVTGDGPHVRTNHAESQSYQRVKAISDAFCVNRSASCAVSLCWHHGEFAMSLDRP